MKALCFAEQFCQRHCHSHLASINSKKDYLHILDIINGSKIESNHLSTNSTWFGLKQNNSYYYNHKYLDNSTFDYSIFTDVYAWNINNIDNDSNSNRIQLDSYYNYAWMNAQSCDNNQRFICNQCKWNVFTKYIIVDQYKYTWNAAQNYCRSEFGTSLASIHNEADYNESRLLCQLSGEDSCWIGLEANAWSDGTEFNYGNQNAYDTCIDYNQLYNYKWNENDCSQQVHSL